MPPKKDTKAPAVQKSPNKVTGTHSRDISLFEILDTGAFASMETVDVLKYMLIEMCSMNRKLTNFQADLTSVKQKQAVMDNSLKYLNSDVEILQTQLKSVNEEVLKLKASLGQVNVKTDSNTQKIKSVDNYSRRICLEISDIPVKENENCYHIAQDVFDFVGCDVPSEEISVAHRLKSSSANSTPPPIIVRFRDMYYRNFVLNDRKSNRVPVSELGFVNPSDTKRQFAYINEHLSPEMKRLLFLTRSKKIEKNWLKAWVHDGKIFAKKSEACDKVEITQESDLKCFSH